jgi:hypothetical protein
MPRATAKRQPKKRSFKTPLADRPSPVEPMGLRIPHAAHALQISERTVWEWIRRGPLEVIRPSPGVTIVTMESIRRAGRSSTP